MKQKFISLFDRYTHGAMPRRVFLGKLTVLAGSAAAASTILPLLEGSGAEAAQVDPEDPRLDTMMENYSGKHQMDAYVAMRKDTERAPAVIVIHQNRGLTSHIRDVARRMALEGFLAIAPDALSPLGGATDDQDAGRLRMRELDQDETVENFSAAVPFAANHARSTGKVGVTGFCWGGSMTGAMAAVAPGLSAASIYYGSPPTEQIAMTIRIPIMAHYAGLDDRINARVPMFEAGLHSAGVDYQFFTYEGANHAFNDDTRVARYDEAAATTAWARTVEFFHEHLDS